jgi:antitoxin component YwqK of YwqJK toxin-antitoxin module
MCYCRRAAEKNKSMNDKQYKNGQIISEQTGDQLTYFYKNGKIKAQGTSINNIMEGKWTFYRETGQLWQIGHFKNGQKHGNFTRYDSNNNVEYDENFHESKLIKQAK